MRKVSDFRSDLQLIQKSILNFPRIQRKIENTYSFFDLIQKGFRIKTETILKNFWISTEKKCYSAEWMLGTVKQSKTIQS